MEKDWLWNVANQTLNFLSSVLYRHRLLQHYVSKELKGEMW